MFGKKLGVVAASVALCSVVLTACGGAEVNNGEPRIRMLRRTARSLLPYGFLMQIRCTMQQLKLPQQKSALI